MKKNYLISLCMLMLLSGCASRPAELKAPCHQFGRFCHQYPINEGPLEGEKTCAAQRK